MRNRIGTIYYTVLLVPIVFLLLVLALYSHPTADDYGYASMLNGKSFWEASIDKYMNWGSRYIATSILMLNPIRYDLWWGYTVISSLMIIGFFISLLLLFKALFNNIRLAFQITAIIFIAFVASVPELVSSFYWLAGSITYHLSIILIVLFLATLFYSDKMIAKIILVILAFLIIGCNEIIMIYIDGIMLLLVLYSYIYNNKKGLVFYIGLFLIVLGFNLIIFLSPGNITRTGIIEGSKDLYFSVFGSFKKILVMLVRYGIFSFSLIFIGMLSISKEIKEQSLWIDKIPLWLVILSLVGFMFMGLSLALWSLGEYPPGRTLNVVYFAMIVHFFMIIYIIIKKYNTIFQVSRNVLCVLFLVVLGGYCIMKIQNRNIVNNIYTIVSDVFTGRAKSFDKGMKARYKLIKESKEDIVYVPKIGNYPESIFSVELSIDPNYFYNQGMASFYNKKQIILENK